MLIRLGSVDSSAAGDESVAGGAGEGTDVDDTVVACVVDDGDDDDAAAGGGDDEDNVADDDDDDDDDGVGTCADNAPVFCCS